MSEIDVGILKQEILSLLVSAKNGLSEHELRNDYRLFNSNKDLPYRDLGYPSLISLLRSWPDVCRFQQQGNNGAIKILAVEEESTKHILSMVKGQRQGKSRRRGRGGRNRGRGGGGGGGGGRNGARDNRGARFSQQGSFNINNTRYGNNNRGTSNGRVAQNINRSERSTASSRSTTTQSNQNSRNRSNGPIAPRFGKQQQQQIRSYLSSSNQSSTSSYDSRQSTNLHFVDDRRVINNSTSLQITVNNNGNNNNNRNNNFNEYTNDCQSSPDTPSHLSEYELNEDEEQYDKEEEVINNLQTLLTEYSHGIRLLSLNDLYQKKFGKNLLTELKIANILLLQDFVDDFASIARHGEENGSCDHIITLKDPKQIAQTQAHLLQQITDSGIVPNSFCYANNLFSYINDPRFQGFVSDIDKNEHCLHIQPMRYQEHIETLMEELDSYYSSPISNSLIINNIETGLSCVTKYDGLYHRVFIKESDLYKCVIVYVDYGTTEEINKTDQQFKYLVKHFAELPCMALACRLDDVSFIPDDNHWLPDTYNEVYSLCQHGPFFIEPTGYMNGLLTIRILDASERSLNDIVVELKLAVRLSTFANNSPIDKQEEQNTPKPVALSFNFLDNAVQCPLPDSEPTTPDENLSNSTFKYPDSTNEHQYKLIQIDENTSFYLIRQNNKPYISCFNLARLLHLSESDILSETLLPRIRYQQTNENSAIFNFLKQSDIKDCLHIHQNFLFIFDLISIKKYIEQFNQTNSNKQIFLEILQQQIQTCNQPQFWSNVSDYYKQSKPILSVQSDVERYNELLTRRNILCNILRTNDVNECSIEIESIENELQQLVEKMRLGTTTQQNGNSSLATPPGFIISNHTDQQRSITNKTDKLRDLMQRCKQLINTILVLDDYIPVDENITKYIQANLPFLNSSRKSLHDDQLYQHYTALLENLTVIVDDLRRKLSTDTI